MFLKSSICTLAKSIASLHSSTNGKSIVQRCSIASLQLSGHRKNIMQRCSITHIPTNCTSSIANTNRQTQSNLIGFSHYSTNTTPTNVISHNSNSPTIDDRSHAASNNVIVQIVRPGEDSISTIQTSSASMACNKSSNGIPSCNSSLSNVISTVDAVDDDVVLEDEYFLRMASFSVAMLIRPLR